MLWVERTQLVTCQRNQLTLGVPLPGGGHGLTLADRRLPAKQYQHWFLLRGVAREDEAPDALLEAVLQLPFGEEAVARLSHDHQAGPVPPASAGCAR
ncbi:hypothetical protein GCM10009549_50020 [Streptomyces thermoalcalitolerans]|uniref:Uncharacterized protein n=1 Tax=Streptomyces thermoalcalitolerans TaxID=65605 RepID=A0ABN1PGD3_9ACTN